MSTELCAKVLAIAQPPGGRPRRHMPACGRLGPRGRHGHGPGFCAHSVLIRD